MRIILGRYGMRGGKQDSSSRVVSAVDLTGPTGEMNWAKLRREIAEAIAEVREDASTTGLVERIEIQIQRGS